MYHSNFVHLHVHSHYSLLDGAANVKSIVEAARRYRMPAIALTDHGNMFGAIDFYGTAMKRGVKPILGFESYVVEGSRHTRGENKENKYYHLTLLARDMTGYKNLIKLTSFGYTEGFYYKPRIDWEVLEKHNQGLIVLSGCLQGRIPQLLLQGKQDEADATARRYQDIFGPENFYIEIMNHAIEDEMRVLGPLIELARRLEIPLVATNDSHYATAADWEAQDALLCLATNKLLNDPTRWRFESRDLYVKSPQQMAELFRDVPDALTNTLRIADRCNVILPMGKSILPHFELPDGLDSNAYLEKLCREALPGRYGDPIPEEINKRLEYELGVIKRMGFPDYFLIVWDFIAEARRIGVPVGPGRGSAAGSIVAYLLGITDIDPLKYGLLFERFLNPDRISMPDIDIDFSDEGRERVIEYVVKKYGREKVSQVITFNTMLAKMAIRDIGRVMGIPISEVDKLAKLVPEKPGTHLKKVLSEDGELKTVNETGTEQERQLLRIAASVDGMVRHTGVHAAGVVISREPIMDIVPLYKDPKSGAIVTQYEKNAIEKIGLLKMDFLGLKTLSVIQRALDYIKEGRGVELNLGKLAVDDQPTYDLLCKGLTMGVFQLESAGMRSLITRLRPTVFEDIIALLAMYRPGPLGSGMVDDFVECKHGRKKIVYPHPELESVLKDTYGVFLYQEQCMKTANILAGFTMGEADALRKAMAKKIPEAMEKMGKLFVSGAVKKGIPQEQAQSIFDIMASFGEYGFNKSHSAAYALVTYHTAYLKAHYPAEFMAAVLSSEVNDTDKIAEYIGECKAMNIEVLPPDINKAKKRFTVENKPGTPATRAIRFGLVAIKGVGEAVVDAIIAAREKGGEFKNLLDFTRRVDRKIINSKAVESLVKGGAFDIWGINRGVLLAMVPDALKLGAQSQSEKETGQATFFDLLGNESDSFGATEMPLPKVPEMSRRDVLAAEKEALGFYFSGNPFAEVAPVGRLFANITIKDLIERTPSDPVRITGILLSMKKHTTKKGDLMAFMIIEDDTASLDVTMFPAMYSAVAARLTVDQPLFLVVRAEPPAGESDKPRVSIEELYFEDDLGKDGFVNLDLIVPLAQNNPDNLKKLHSIVRRFPGTTPFGLIVPTPSGERVRLKPPTHLRVSFCAGLVREWETICGPRSVAAQFPEVGKASARNANRNQYRNRQAAG